MNSSGLGSFSGATAAAIALRESGAGFPVPMMAIIRSSVRSSVPTAELVHLPARSYLLPPAASAPRPAAAPAPGAGRRRCPWAGRPTRASLLLQALPLVVLGRSRLPSRGAGPRCSCPQWMNHHPAALPGLPRASTLSTTTTVIRARPAEVGLARHQHRGHRVQVRRRRSPCRRRSAPAPLASKVLASSEPSTAAWAGCRCAAASCPAAGCPRPGPHLVGGA